MSSRISAVNVSYRENLPSKERVSARPNTVELKDVQSGSARLLRPTELQDTYESSSPDEQFPSLDVITQRILRAMRNSLEKAAEEAAQRAAEQAIATQQTSQADEQPAIAGSNDNAETAADPGQTAIGQGQPNAQAVPGNVTAPVANGSDAQRASKTGQVLSSANPFQPRGVEGEKPVAQAQLGIRPGSGTQNASKTDEGRAILQQATNALRKSSAPEIENVHRFQSTSVPLKSVESAVKVAKPSSSFPQ